MPSRWYRGCGHFHLATCRSCCQAGQICGFPDKAGPEPTTFSPFQVEEPFVFSIQGVSLNPKSFLCPGPQSPLCTRRGLDK